MWLKCISHLSSYITFYIEKVPWVMSENGSLGPWQSHWPKTTRNIDGSFNLCKNPDMTQELGACEKEGVWHLMKKTQQLYKLTQSIGL